MNKLLDKFFEGLGVLSWDFKGRRIINAGRSVGRSDYTIKDELDIVNNLDISKLTNHDSVITGRQNDKFVIAYKISGVVNYISIPLDGAATTWTHSTVEP